MYSIIAVQQIAPRGQYPQPWTAQCPNVWLKWPIIMVGRHCFKLFCSPILYLLETHKVCFVLKCPSCLICPSSWRANLNLFAVSPGAPSSQPFDFSSCCGAVFLPSLFYVSLILFLHFGLSGQRFSFGLGLPSWPVSLRFLNIQHAPSPRRLLLVPNSCQP